MSPEGRIRFVPIDRHGSQIGGSLEAWVAMDRQEPCRYCAHEQHYHDDDDACTVTGCPCAQFQYTEVNPK